MRQLAALAAIVLTAGCAPEGWAELHIYRIGFGNDEVESVLVEVQVSDGARANQVCRPAQEHFGPDGRPLDWPLDVLLIDESGGWSCIATRITVEFSDRSTGVTERHFCGVDFSEGPSYSLYISENCFPPDSDPAPCSGDQVCWEENGTNCAEPLESNEYFVNFADAPACVARDPE